MTESKKINLFDSFPPANELLAGYRDNEREILDVNTHIHTPYSFSAFQNIEQAVNLAKAENVRVLGINDFNTTGGYKEFADCCLTANIFPLFNIEFIGLIKEDQLNNFRINDWNNAGRIYLSGKGLNPNYELSPGNQTRLNAVLKAGEDQMIEMINKLNVILQYFNSDFHLSLDEIRSKFSNNLVRERHLAKAIRVKAGELFPNEIDRNLFYKNLFGKMPQSEPDNFAALENEIRSVLLKAGGKAFVPEDEEAFMSMEEIKEIIYDAGGIPAYPVLLDDEKYNFTNLEGDKQNLLKRLLDWRIFNMEFIPVRNNITILKNYVKFFYNHGFSITFGTEHNTPELIPLKAYCRSKTELDEYLRRINYKGACVLAAHQYLIGRGEEGYQNKSSSLNLKRREEFEKLGDAVIDFYMKEKKKNG